MTTVCRRIFWRLYICAEIENHNGRLYAWRFYLAWKRGKFWK